jgi:uncharacterized protein (TIGR03083 family)
LKNNGSILHPFEACLVNNQHAGASHDQGICEAKNHMKPLKPISTVELFPPLSEELISLLRRLSYRDWERPTVCTGWSVKDVGAHLLGGNLSRLQDDYPKTTPSPAPSPSMNELVRMIDRNNAEWVLAARRISPSLLIEFLELSDQRLYRHFKSLVKNEEARWAVTWAGDQQSPNWFDIAREYSEKWLHQQHIREAVEQPLLNGRPWLFPVLDTFMRALPYTYRNVAAAEGVILSFSVTGEAGGQWSLLRQNEKWCLFSGSSPEAASHVSLDHDCAWRLFSKGIDWETAQARVKLEGNQELGSGILRMIAIMA